MSITGSASAVIRPSTLRSPSRRQRVTIVATAVSPAAGRLVVARGAGRARSDMSGCLQFVVGAVRVRGGGPGRVAGQGQEHVVQAGRPDPERADQRPVRVYLVEHRADVRGGA